MDLEELSALVATTRNGTITDAAKALCVTQPTLSRRLKRLEEELGVRLFERTRPSLRLTRQGFQVLAFAERVLELWEDLRLVLAEEERVEGTLAVAASTTPAETLVPALLADFRRRYPNVQIRLTVHASRLVEAAVHQGLADVGFVGCPPETPGLRAVRVGEEEVCLVVPAGHPLSRIERPSIREALRYAFVVRTRDSGTRQIVWEALRRVGVDPEGLAVALEVDSTRALITAVRLGVGIGFASRTLVTGEAGVVPVRCSDFLLTRPLYCLVRPPLYGLVRRFVREVMERPLRSVDREVGNE